MQEQRRAARLQAVEQRRDTAQAAAVCDRGGGEGDPEGAGVEEVVDVGCARGVEADGAPECERVAELEDAVVEGVEQRLGLFGREGLDAEGARQGDDDAVDVVKLGAGVRVVVGGVERRGWLAGEVEDAVGDPGGGRAAAEGRDQVFGEEVLVDVGAHAGWHIATKSTGLVGKGEQLRIEGKVRGAPALL